MDDDIAEISAVKRLLLRAGCQSVLATNASDARATASQQQIDAAIVAASCDGGEGLRLARELASGDRPRPISLIILGEVADPPQGASIIPQPVDPTQLADELKRLLDNPHPPKSALTPDPAPQGLRPPSPPALWPPAPDHAERRAAADALRSRAAELRSSGARTTMTLPAASLPAVGRPAPFMASPLSDELDPELDPGAALDLLPPLSAEEQIARDIEEVTGEVDPGLDDEAAREPLTLIDAEPLPARLRREQAEAAAQRASEPPAPSLTELEPELDELLFSPSLVEAAQAEADAKEEAERARLAAEEQARAEAEAELEEARRAEQEAEDAARLAAERARAEAELEETRRAAEEETERARTAAEQVRRDHDAHRAQLTAERAKAAEVDLARRAAEQEAERARTMVEQARAEVEAERARREQEAQEKERAEEAAELARRDAERAQAEVQTERARRVEMVEETARLEAEAQEGTERARAAEEKAEVEAEARRRAEEGLRLAGEQLVRERLEHGAALARERERAQAEQQAAEELRALAQEEEQRKAEVRLTEVEELRKKEEELRRAAEAAELARRELAEQKKRAEEEARRRIETERELARLAQVQKERKRVEGAHRRAEIEAELERFAREDEAIEKAADEQQPSPEEPQPQPFSEIDPERDALDAAFQRAATQDALARETSQEAVRRKVVAMAAEKRSAPAGRPAATEPPAPPRAWMPPLPRGPEAAPAVTPAPVAAPGSPQQRATPASPPSALPEPEESEQSELDASSVPPVLSAGSTSELPIPRLLALAVRAGLTGRLDFTGDAPRSLYFEDGRIVGASSGTPHERVEEVALRVGLITRDQFRTIAPAAAGLSSRRVAVLLLERGFLKPTELTPLVRRRTEDILYNLFGDAETRYRYAAARVPPDERVALERGTLALAVEGVRRRWLAPRIDPLLGGPGTLLAPTPEPPPLAELGLSPQEQRLVQSADGLRTNDEVVAGAGMDPLSARQCLAALLMIGSLSLRIHVPLGTGQAATSRIDLARVREKLDQVRRADYFTILGLPRLCSPHEIREAAARLESEFEAQRFAGYSEDGLAERLLEIQHVIREASEVLADDQLRAEYIRGLGD